MMKPRVNPWRRRCAAALTVSLSLLGVAVSAAPGAQAVACVSPVKYSASSNTIYLLTARTFTLTDIMSLCAGAPLTKDGPGVWELSADLVLNNGATLSLRPTSAGGDVNTLRLRSLSDSAKTNVSVITARWGTIDVDGVHITSWDDAAGAPDINSDLPTGAPATSRARAYIRAQSYVDPTTGPHVSSMTINNSTVSDLGYFAAESYGLSWKSVGCVHDTGLATCAAAPVIGGAQNSIFTGNYMGSYVWGGNPMTFLDNTFDHNVMYGLDTHDVTKNLDVERNHFSNNGDHGFICSQACDNLTVTGNESDHNGMVPWTGPAGDAPGGQVHGIMLHRGITRATVSNNSVHDQPNGAGIAVFDTSNATISNNTIDKALYGIRLSVGSANNAVVNNRVTRSISYGLYSFKGTDLPTYTTSSGHPTGNVFTGNSVTLSGSDAIKLGETDGTRFSDQTYGGNPVHIDSSAGTTIKGGVSDGERVEATGTSAEPTTVTIADPAGSLVTAIADVNSTIHLTSSSAQLYTLAGTWFSTTITSTGSDMKLAFANTGSSGKTVAPAKVTALTSSGTAKAKASTTTSGVRQISLSPSSSTQRIAVTVAGLTASHTYKVKSSATGTASVTTNSAGILNFVDPGKATTYTVTP